MSGGSGPAAGTELLVRWMRNCAATFAAQREYLTDLDAAIGDADHADNMTRGFTAVAERLDGLESDAVPGRVLVLAGSTLISTVGGASGPLWGSALRRAGKTLGEERTITTTGMAAALAAAVTAIVELGEAQPGDKTMVDALAPAAAALQAAGEAGVPLGEALAAARMAAEDGMRATIAMPARKGRASYLGERSVGHQDPGATSAAFIIAALEQAVADG